jgi:hypothetical protein
MPVELEKRAMIGVEGFWKCGARDNVFAVEVLVKWPFRRMPLACAGFHFVSQVSSSTATALRMIMGLRYRVEILRESRKWFAWF